MAVRGIRGAITVKENSEEAILSATRELLCGIQELNPGLFSLDICSVIFTMTDDLSATFPAEAARNMGWSQVPLLCSREIPVKNALPMCIRVLVHWNTDKEQSNITHVYLGEASQLRPDINSAQ